MIIHIFIGLLILGLIAFSYRGVRFQRFFTFLAILAVGYIGWIFYTSWQNNITDSYSFLWLSSKYYPVSLNFFSGEEIYKQVTPFFIIAAISCLFVLGNKQERQKLNIIALAILNLAAIIMLICGQNTLQLLVATCFIDVLGFCAINDMTARRQYIFYNLLTDLGLFTAFAMLWGVYNTNQLQLLADKSHNSIPLYLMLISAIFKAGLFPFQGYYLQIAAIKDSRRNIISFLSTPIAGFFILWKLIPLISGNTICFQILSIEVILSLAWNLFGGLITENLNNKKMHINLSFYALAFFVILTGKEQEFECLGKLLILQFLLDNVLQYGRKYLLAQYAAVILLISAIILIILHSPQLICSSYLLILMLIAGGVMHQIQKEQIEEQNIFSLILAGLAASYFINEEMLQSLAFWGYLVGFIILLTGYPYHWLPSIKRTSTIDICSKWLYLLFVAPIEFLGRILWLTIDFLIIERTFLNGLSKCCTILQVFFERIHHLSIRNALLFWLLGLIIISYCLYGEKL